MTVLLVIIYLAFISLGLPDSMLGSAWPSMYGGLGVPLASAGIVSMIIASGTIISSLLSEKLIRRLGTSLVTLLSVGLTATALLGISLSKSFIWVCLWAAPLGLGAGSVDAALNNFVALHYRAAHMNWLHCFWGVGASVGPVIVSAFLSSTGSWRDGYRAVSMIQFALVAILAVSLPLWRRARATDPQSAQSSARSLSIRQALALRGAKATLTAFFCYCAIESAVGLWGSTFLVMVRGVAADTAASWIALYYLGITLGRFVSGVLSVKLSSPQMLRLGQALIVIGVLMLFLPVSGWPLLVGLFCIGLGCAPIFPTLLHETPNNFGKDNSQAIMGIQMACAYMGGMFAPPLFGLLGTALGYGLLPLYVGGLWALMAVTLALARRAIQRA